MRLRLGMATWLLLLFAASLMASTWGTWNGVTVGTSTGNVSSFGGTTIGGSAGNIGSLNGLTSPSGSTPISLIGTNCSSNTSSSTATGGCQSNGGTGLSVTFTYNGATAGNALIVAGNESSGACTILTLTDTGTGNITSQTWTTTTAGRRLNGSYIITNISAGAHQLTLTASSGCTGNNFVEIAVREAAGMTTSASPIDQTLTNQEDASAGTAHVGSPSMTSTVAKTLMIGTSHCSGSNGTVSGLTSGWTSLGFLDSTNWNTWYYRISSATETQSYNYTSSASVSCSFSITNYKGN